MRKSNREIIAAIIDLLNELIEQDEQNIREQENQKKSEPLEMLTVKECAKEVKGLTENTVRQFIKQDKLPYIRSGKGEHGKILIKKSDLINCINKMTTLESF